MSAKRDRMQQSRFELKYLIPEEVAVKLRDFIKCYLDMDEYGVGRPNYSYDVHSLYLDSDDLQIYWRTVNGDKNRYKLRLRYYTDNPDSPVFFEIKRRMKDVIMKQRGGVKQSAVADLLNGYFPGPEQMISKDPGSLVAVQRFVELMSRMQAKPRSHIYYMREAYVEPDNDEVRVTFDRSVYSEACLEPAAKIKMNNPVQSYAGLVILELKFTNRYPNWFRELVRVAQVMQCGAAKYVSGISLMGHTNLAAYGAVMEEESLLSCFRPGDDLPAFARQDLGIVNHPGDRPVRW
jgi:hypothetical protein